MATMREFLALLGVWLVVQTSLPFASPLRLRNSVRSFDDTSCPDRCKCKARAVYCDGIKIEAVPRRLPRNLATLRFKDNRIRSLRYGSFRRMFDLRHLIVTGNRVSHVESTAFKDLHSLISLSLSQNELNWLSEDTFKHQLLLKELSLSRNRLKDVELILSYLENVELLNLAENQLEEITDRTFQGNVAVRILDLHGNRLRHIHSSAFRRLEALTFLILRDNPLAEVYVQFRTNHQLEQLDVARCQLTAVMKDTPPGLRDLRLSENNIKHVDSDDFQNPSSIQLLVLSQNSIDVLPDSALMGMTELYDLHLTQNRISQLPNSLPDSLHGLYASHNRITEIGGKCFSKQRQLILLVLSHNRISDIDPKAMNNLRSLESLDLSYNDIRVLRTGVFRGLLSLQRLDLSNNPLFQMEPRSLVGLENLHILKMSSVEGSDLVRTSALGDLPGLRFLDLSNSSRIAHRLLTRDEYAMQSIETIEDLNAMNSGLRVLPPTLRRTLRYLRDAKLTGNPWHCDTNIGWMSQWMRSGDVNFFEPDNMVCSSPARLRGRRLLDLDWNDFAKATYAPHRRRGGPKTTLSTRRTIPATTSLPTIAIFDEYTTTTPATTTPTTTTPTTTTTETTTRAEITTTTAQTTTTTSPTTTTTTTTTTTQPSSSSQYPLVPTRGAGVFIQIKRLKKGENVSTSVRLYPTTPHYPPPPPLGSELPSAEYLAFRYPRYSLFRIDSHDYANDEESSTPFDYDDDTFLSAPRHHYDDDVNDDYYDENDDDDDGKNIELDKDDEFQKEELIKITNLKSTSDDNNKNSSKLGERTT